MDFTLNDEQQMLKDSARRFLEQTCAFETRSDLVERGSFDQARWERFAEMGWLAMALPEEYEGLGSSAIETTILMEELGRVLCVEPFWAIGVLAAQVIVASGDEDKAAQILPQLAAGTARPVLAHGEPESRGALAYVATSAQPDGNSGWRLDGHKSLVVGGNVADRFIVSARTGGAAGDEEGITLFIVPCDTPGLTVRALRLVDNRWCADIELAGVRVGNDAILGRRGGAYEALDHAHAHALVALCAEAVGVMEKALWITRDYLKMRKQFGVTLNTFQALQHRMSDMLLELELARGMVHKALAAMAAPPRERARALSSAKIQVGRSGKFVCGQAIQLHGGIGVTEEYVIGHHFKRMTAIEYALGSSHAHLERLAQDERLRA